MSGAVFASIAQENAVWPSRGAADEWGSVRVVIEPTSLRIPRVPVHLPTAQIGRMQLPKPKGVDLFDHRRR